MSAILNSLCRLCAKPNKQLLYLQKEMLHQISLMFEMNIGQFDEQIPKRICRRCRCIVLKSWNFFKQMHVAQKFFADFFSAEDNVETIVICPEQSEIRDFSQCFERSNENLDTEELQTSKNVEQNNSDSVLDSTETPTDIVETNSENNLVRKRLENKLENNENDILQNKNGNIKSMRKEYQPISAYVCNICDQSFDEEESLKSHMRDHKRAKPFKCYLCSFRYNDLPYWHSHLRTIHGIVFKVSENDDFNEETVDSTETSVEKRPKY